MKLLVIGSGPTGIHFAMSALKRNHQITMIDVATPRPSIMLPDADFTGLKSNLADPARYFLGRTFHAAMLPDGGAYSDYYGFPPSKDFVFEAPEYFRYEANEFFPLTSFASGGLAEAWTGGCYAFGDAELSSFPFAYKDIKPYYDEVARRIGVAGREDDLGQFFPSHAHLSEPLLLDENSTRLLDRYDGRRNELAKKYKIRLGHSRQAVLTQPREGRRGCSYCGRCMWGCPTGALYTPSLSLQECTSHSKFSYKTGLFASHFNLASNGQIDHLICYPIAGGADNKFTADAYIVACGTLSTANLILRSIYRSTGEIIKLPGLMDNRQVLAPFFNLSMLGRSYNPESYQYHQLAIGMTSKIERHIHGQITTLKTATIHPIIQNLPFDLRTSTGIFSNLRSGLGALSLFFCDDRREENYLSLTRPPRRADEFWPRLYIHYETSKDEAALIKDAMARVRPFFSALNAPLIPGMTKVRPVGGGVHYAGTLPMSTTRKSWSLSDKCQSYDILNMFVVDGSGFPYLPAKNLTFTLMANAVRVAETAF